MAGKDFRLTALLSVRDSMSPIVKAASQRWVGFQKVINSTEFSALQKQLRLFNRSLKNTVDSAKESFRQLALPATAAIGAMGVGLQQSVTGFASTGDAIDKMSARVGISAEKLQEWSYAAKNNGSSAEKLEDGLKDLSKHIVEIASGKDTTSSAATLFQALGISVKDAKGNLRSTEVVFQELADAIQRNEDPALRASMAMAVLGEGGRQLVPMLSQGSAGLKEMGQQARAMGIVMSEEDVAAAASLQTSLDNMKAVFTSVSNTIGAKLAPAVMRISESFKNLAIANREAFSERFASVATQFGEAFSKINFQGIADAILTVADVALRVFNILGGFNTIIYAMSAIMAGKAIVSVVAFGSNLITLGKTLYGLAGTARAVGMAMATALGPVGLAITAIAIAAALVIANWDSICEAVRQSYDAFVGWISSLWDSVVSAIQAGFSAYLDWITSCWDAITSAFSSIGDAWTNACTGWYASVKDSLLHVWEMIKSFFSGIDLSSLIPDGLKRIFNFVGGGIQSTAMPAVDPVAQMNGQMAIRVTAAGGAAAQIDDISSDGGLSIIGSVGRSDRSMEDY